MASVLRSEPMEWNALPYEFLYIVYRRWLPRQDFKHTDRPLSFRQFAAALRNTSDHLTKKALEPWRTEDGGRITMADMTGENAAVKTYHMEKWMENNKNGYFSGLMRK